VREERIEKVLGFWFGDLPDEWTYPTEKAHQWFRGDEAFHRRIREEFGEDLKLAEEGQLDSWAATARGRLALIIVIDQFVRNIYQDSPHAFAQDAKALELTLVGIDQELDLKLKPVERHFFYMPLMHAENRAAQKKSVELFTKLADDCPPAVEIPMRMALDYAERHAKIIERFGRFPHRNEDLGRASTPEEIGFLKEPNSSF